MDLEPFRYRVDTSGPQITAGLVFAHDGGGSRSLDINSDAALVEGSVYQLLISINEPAGVGFLCRNGAYDPVGSSPTFNAAYATPGTGLPLNGAKIGARGDGLGKLAAGTLIYRTRLYNRALSIEEANANFQKHRSAHGL